MCSGSFNIYLKSTVYDSGPHLLNSSRNIFIIINFEHVRYMSI